MEAPCEMKWKSETLEDGEGGGAERPLGLNEGNSVKLCSQNRFLRIELMS